MKREDFADDAPGELIANLNGDFTFMPRPLPGPLRLDNELVGLLTEAERRLGRVSGIASTLPDPTIVTRAFVRREAQLSSRIENTFAELDEMALAAGRPDARQPNDVREVLNNEDAILFALEQVDRGRPVTASLLKDMHALLLRDTRGQDKRPGQYRDEQVLIGRTAAIRDAAFVPPPSHTITGLMDDLDRYLQTTDDSPQLVRIGMVHYHFETIHPFADGNGRTGRALILLLMCVGGLLPLPTLNPSLHMERERETYYLRLREVSTRNKWMAWIKFFAKSVAVAADDAIEKIDAIKRLQADYHARLQKQGRSALTLKLVDRLFVDQVISKPQAAQLLGINHTPASNHINHLLKLGILQPVPGLANPQLFIARDIIKAIQ